ncbi:MAG: GNAT family N-acetyltransferase [Deltaproteobacteria bacterium]|nr:MAG: GNAT family N-acetyltransferase [Deltaproteobacteria bacterium]
MRIREAEPADIGALARLHVDTWHETYAGRLPDDLLAKLTVEARERLWTEMIGQPGTHHLVLDDDGSLVGFASAGPRREGLPDDLGVQLYALYLRRRVQGHGHGRHLLEAVHARLSEGGHAAVGLWVLDGNPAEAFYTRMGGVRFGTRRDAVLGIFVDHVGMRLPTGHSPT